MTTQGELSEALELQSGDQFCSTVHGNTCQKTNKTKKPNKNQTTNRQTNKKPKQKATKKESDVFTTDFFLPKCTLYGPKWLNHYEKRIPLNKMNTSGIKNSHQSYNVFDREEKNNYKANSLTHLSILGSVCKQQTLQRDQVMSSEQKCYSGRSEGSCNTKWAGF